MSTEINKTTSTAPVPYEENPIYKQNKEMLINNYTNAETKLAQQKKQSEIAANIAYEKLLKYLPEMNKANGLGGLGVAGSTYNDAYNKFVNNQSQISGNYNANLTDLYGKKSTDLAALDEKYSDKYETDLKAYTNKLETEATNKSAGYYNTLLDLQADGATMSDLERYYGSVKDKMTVDDQTNANTMLDYYRNSPAQAQSDLTNEQLAKQIAEERLENSNWDKDIEETGKKIQVLNSSVDGSSKTWDDNYANNFGLQYNGKKYQAEVGDEVSKNVQPAIKEYVKRQLGREMQVGDVIIYDGKAVFVSTGGNLRYLKNRGWHLWNTGKNVTDLINDSKK